MGQGNGGVGHIGVLMGGPSAERAISLKSGKAVFAALQEQGYTVSMIEIPATQPEVVVDQLQRQGVDLAFIALHGAFGEDGTVQTLLDEAGIVYTGSGAAASRLAMDKAATQARLSTEAICIPPHRVLRRGDRWSASELLALSADGRLVVKPSAQGSSLGVTIVAETAELSAAMEQAFGFGDEVLVEAFISGRELTCGILGADALPVVEIRPRNRFFDYNAKYQSGQSEYVVPAEIPADAAAQIQDLALRVFHHLGCRDLARMDFILPESGPAVFLEANTIPGFTATSLLPMAARQNGLSFEELCGRIVLMAAQRGKILIEKT